MTCIKLQPGADPGPLRDIPVPASPSCRPCYTALAPATHGRTLIRPSLLAEMSHPRCGQTWAPPHASVKAQAPHMAARS